MVEHAAPTLQPTQNIQNITSSTLAGRKTFVFYRNITTTDANDYSFSYMPGNLDFAWAYGFNLSLSTHSDIGGSSLNFINPCTNLNPTILPNITICNGDSALIFGQYKKIATTYSKIFPKQFACDSIVKQTLIIKNPVSTILNPVSICNGDSTLIFGQYRKISGTYYDTLQTIFSCDSILIQSLTVGNAVVINLPSIEICSGDSAFIFGSYRHNPGTYADTLFTMQGCDSISKIQLNVYSIDNTVIINADSLIALQGADAYQWYNCNTNQMINDETNYFLKTNISGLYKVKITKNNCTSYSSCYQLNTTSVTEIKKKEADFNIISNPASDKISIDINFVSENAKVEIIDITGKAVIIHLFKNKIFTDNIDISDLKKGLYFAKLSIDNHTMVKKLIIK